LIEETADFLNSIGVRVPDRREIFVWFNFRSWSFVRDHKYPSLELVTSFPSAFRKLSRSTQYWEAKFLCIE
jgi:hypothetical protein